jgi:hypothetical protein
MITKLNGLRRTPLQRMFSNAAATELKQHESVPLSTLRYDQITRKYVFTKDETSEIQSLFENNMSKVYFIRNFPSIVKPENDTDSMDFIKSTFVTKPHMRYKMEDAYTIVNMMKQNLNVSHVVGFYELPEASYG